MIDNPIEFKEEDFLKIQEKYNDNNFYKNKFIDSVQVTKSQHLVIYYSRDIVHQTDRIGFRFFNNREQGSEFRPQKQGFHISLKLFNDRLLPVLIDYAKSQSNSVDKSE